MQEDIRYQKTVCSEDEFIILEQLLAASGQFVSSNYLAEKLGISRPTLWKKMEQLRQQGFEIEAVRNRGYRILHMPDRLHPGLIRYYMEKEALAADVLYFSIIDSTNSEAERQYAHGRRGPFAVVASAQTKGRGRLGRDWHSASVDNLYLSVLFEPKLPATRLQSFTLWAGVYICRELQKWVPKMPLKIKWPNDLHCAGRKFAGMLTEAKMDADSVRCIIFGIGINVNSNPTRFPAALRDSATSLYAIHGKELPLNQLVARVLQAIHQAYATCIHDNTNESLPEAWAPLNALAGKTVTAYQNGNALHGIASGIETSGGLLLTQPDGSTLAVHAGEVTLRNP